MTAEELERQAEENLAGCRMSLDSIARWFRADASAIRDYTPMADAVPTRTETGILTDFPAARYLFERAGRVRAAIPEEEAYYEDRRRSGAWPDLYATSELRSPVEATRAPLIAPSAGRAGEPQTPGSNAQDEGRALGGLNSAQDLPGRGLPADRRDAVGAHVDRPATGEPDATGPEPCPPAGPVAQPDDDPPPKLDERGEEALERFNALHDAQPDEDGDLG